MRGQNYDCVHIIYFLTYTMYIICDSIHCNMSLYIWYTICTEYFSHLSHYVRSALCNIGVRDSSWRSDSISHNTTPRETSRGTADLKRGMSKFGMSISSLFTLKSGATGGRCTYCVVCVVVYVC